MTKKNKRYQDQPYPIEKAIKLVKEGSTSKFNGSIEVHLITTQIGLKGEINFPHPTGKETRVAIADEKTLAKIAKGKIDFDVLLASATMMPKLAKYARTLGPKGLMPNPKAGTITDDPVKAAQQWQGKAQFKTEIKAPLIHLVIGKVNTPAKQLEENFLVLVTAVGPKNITKAVLAPTMGPGIKVAL